MSARVAGPTSDLFAHGTATPKPTVRRRRRSSRLSAGALGRALWRPAGLVWRAVGKKVRFRLKLVIALVALASPIWGLNLAVAFLGHSVIFPLSPYFLRQKWAALGAYARHRSTCLGHGDESTDLLVRRAESRHRLPRGLLGAVVHVESRGFAHRISYAGAMGAGQLMPDTARELGVGDPFDTAQNVDGAAQLLAGHLARFHNVRLAVAAYNAGPGAVHGRIPSNGQTPIYVTRVMDFYAQSRPRPVRAVAPAPPTVAAEPRSGARRTRLPPAEAAPSRRPRRHRRPVATREPVAARAPVDVDEVPAGD